MKSAARPIQCTIPKSRPPHFSIARSRNRNATRSNVGSALPSVGKGHRTEGSRNDTKQRRAAPVPNAVSSRGDRVNRVLPRPLLLSCARDQVHIRRFLTDADLHFDERQPPLRNA